MRTSMLARARSLLPAAAARRDQALEALRAVEAGIDRAALIVSPRWGLSRMRARAVAGTLLRHYDAASAGRRTTGWTRSTADANAVTRPALSTLRAHARDLVRNNAWARNGLRTITANTVGWGIQPKAVDAGANAAAIAALWRAWAGTTACDADGRLTFYGIQKLAMRTIAEAGEVLIRRRWRRPGDGYPLPMQLQVLEPDFIDHSRDGFTGQQGGPVIQGVEYDAIGRRVAYWLYPVHPGSGRLDTTSSKRIDAADIAHVYDLERPGQVRGVSWFSPAVVALKDFDEYEDAELMRQKIAACFAGFITDVDGEGAAVGTSDPATPLVEVLEPGMIQRLKPGQEITFASPPATADGGFSTRTLRRIAAGLGVTYEDLTGDYSQVNFSSARMARIKHWGHVHDWRENMLVPQLCDPAWRWMLEVADLAGLIRFPAGPLPTALWTPPPMPMLDPAQEGLAISRLVRTGAQTVSGMIREQGLDPETHLEEYAADMKKLDAMGIVLDCDPRNITQSGQAQGSQGAADAQGGSSDAAAPGQKGDSSTTPAAQA